MKKQDSKTVATGSFSEIVQSHKMKEVAPPESARKDGMIMNKAKGPTLAAAAMEWMKTAKSQNPSAGFLEVPSEGLKPSAGMDREMLYKGKKK
jgi:hypothetical protein